MTEAVSEQSETTASIMGYSQSEFDALIEKAVDIYCDHIVSNDSITKKDVYDMIEAASTSMKDAFIITMAIKNIENNDDEEELDIDENIIGVLDFINNFPTLVTVISCGGHEFPADCSQAPLNEWYVNFIVIDPETHEEIDDLEDVKDLTGFISELEFGYDEWIRIECHMTVMGDFYYTMRGHNVDPEEYFPWVCDDCKCETCTGVEA